MTISFGYQSLGAPPQISTAHPTEKLQKLPTNTAMMSGSKLSKLKKIWDRCPKLIPSGGGRNFSLNSAKPTFSKPNRRRTIGTEMIGLPTNFTHSKHIGVQEASTMSYQPRHSITSVVLRDSIALATSLVRPAETKVAPLATISSEEETTFLNSKINGRRSLDCTALPLSRTESQTVSNKIKRKSVPVHVLQELAESASSQRPTESHFDTVNRCRGSGISVEDSMKELIGFSKPELIVDEKGRDLYLVGGEYMSQSIKAKWDDKMAAIARSLQESQGR